MDVQAAPPTYTPAGGMRPPAGNPPVLGQQVPGMSGGLPALGGLSVTQNPMAQELQSYGRGEDTMLVHMTPNEVNSLQGLAMAHGGSLTINPHTGLPEAGWLGRLLPTILGAVGMAFGIPPVWMGALGAAGGTIATGDLGKGLSMGLQAFGGASLGGAAGIGGKLGHVGQSLGLSGSSAAVMNPTTAVLDKAKDAAANKAMQQVAAKGLDIGSKGAQDILANAGKQFTKSSGILGGFGAGAQAGLPGGMFGKVAPMLAAQGVMSGIANATTPTGGYTAADGRIDNSFTGPYRAQSRQMIATPTTEELKSSSGERLWFNNSVPEVYNMQGQVVQPGSNTTPGTMIYQNVLNPNAKKGEPMYSLVGTPFMGPQEEEETPYAKGGEVQLADGAFVVDARTVSELGNGSSGAGQELLARMGGRPVRGPGDGVSDSVPARIGRDQPARVARDEVVFSPEAVRRLGKGNGKKGAKKLYALMEKAHKARKKSARGKDTKLRRGLA